MELDDLDKLAIEAALSILEAHRATPGSQDPATIDLAKQILAGNMYPHQEELPVA